MQGHWGAMQAAAAVYTTLSDTCMTGKACVIGTYLLQDPSVHSVHNRDKKVQSADYIQGRWGAMQAAAAVYNTLTDTCKTGKGCARGTGRKLAQLLYTTPLDTSMTGKACVRGTKLLQDPSVHSMR